MQAVKTNEAVKSRHIVSVVLFVVAVVFLVLGGVVAHNWLIGILIGLAFVFGGLIFYRRGK